MEKTNVETCPICHGNGRVPYSFYIQAGEKGYSSSIWVEECRSCDGKGYIITSRPPTCSEVAEILVSLAKKESQLASLVSISKPKFRDAIS